MSEKTIRIKIGTEEVDAVEVGFKAAEEPLIDLALSDGARVKLKVVVMSVLRAVDKKSPDGNPLYIIKSANVMEVTPCKRPLADCSLVFSICSSSFS